MTASPKHVDLDLAPRLGQLAHDEHADAAVAGPFADLHYGDRARVEDHVTCPALSIS